MFSAGAARELTRRFWHALMNLLRTVTSWRDFNVARLSYEVDDGPDEPLKIDPA
jgi:hypothetical protein